MIVLCIDLTERRKEFDKTAGDNSGLFTQAGVIKSVYKYVIVPVMPCDYRLIVEHYSTA